MRPQIFHLLLELLTFATLDKSDPTNSYSISKISETIEAKVA